MSEAEGAMARAWHHEACVFKSKASHQCKFRVAHERTITGFLAALSADGWRVEREGLDVERLARAFHAVDHPAVPNCELGEGATHPGVRYCVWKMERLAAEYAALRGGPDATD